MNRLAVTLGIVVAISSLAMGFSEDFEGYSAGAQISGTNGWIEREFGDLFETNATTPTDPSFLGSRYADIGNNGNNNYSYSANARIAQMLDETTTGSLVVDFDVSFSIIDEMNSCNIILGDTDRVIGSNDLQAAAIFIGYTGVRVHDGDWRTLENFTAQNDTWYHMWITMDLDAQTWQLAIATYTGDTLGAATTVSYAGIDTFSFRDTTNLDSVGMIELAASSTVMDDSLERGMYVDNIAVPEPATLSLLGITGLLVLRRRK